MNRATAEDHWRHARRKLLYDEVVCLIKRCSVNLLSFDDVQGDLDLSQRVDRGLQKIPLEQIRGSVGRYDDFSSAFLPRKDHMHERWVNVDAAMMQQGKRPPIDVYQVGEDYFVLDGNHRVSSAHRRGLDSIAAYVTEFVTPGELSAPEDVDELFVESERAAFLQQTGAENSATAQSMVFTCSGCYETVSEQIERYRLGAEAAWKEPVTREVAFKRWYEEVYEPSLEAIRRHDLLAQFPERTEGDLFIWAQKNSLALEELEGPEAGQ